MFSGSRRLFDSSANFKIPDTVEVIGESAIENLSDYLFEPLIIPESVKIIERRAFYNFDSRLILINEAEEIHSKAFIHSGINILEYSNSNITPICNPNDLDGTDEAFTPKTSNGYFQYVSVPSYFKDKYFMFKYQITRTSNFHLILLYNFDN